MEGSRSKLWLRAVPAILLVLTVGVFYWWNRKGERDAVEDASGDRIEQTDAALYGGSAFGPLEQAWVDVTGGPPEWPEDFGQPAGCNEEVDRLRGLMLPLDGQDYIRDWQLPAGTFGLFIDATGELASGSPQLGFRLGDSGAVHSNVTHLVRVLGARRTARLALLAARESARAEPLALSIYQWLQAGDSCAADVRPPSAAAQYDYAAFLLQTIGGQGYLRRRAPRIEALISFYTLLIADASISRGYDPQGLELLPEIARCRALIETQPLVFRDHYIELLDTMQRRWES